MKSYSQHQEDTHIFDFIEEKENGVYIDIGAAFPKHINNTYGLYEMGWRGLLIEPCPVFYCMIDQYRPEDILYKGAVLDREGTVDIVSKGHYAVNKDAWIYESHKKRAIEEGHPVLEFTVPCTTLPKLLEKLNRPELWTPDFVSIDIDGSEGAVLSTLDFKVFKPKLILIEVQLRGEDQRPKWTNDLDKYYKEVWSNGSDVFYKRVEE